VTLAALREAQAHGETVGVLHASEMAYSVYRRMGFVECCVWGCYREPPSAQIPRVCAVGRHATASVVRDFLIRRSARACANDSRYSCGCHRPNVVPPGWSMTVVPSPGDAAPLVGRDRELAILRRQLDAALGGRGNLVLIGGEAGIGKTALAEDACRAASDQGFLVLIGRCYDLTETPPYGPWVELCGRYRHADGGPQGGMPPLPAAFADRGTVGAVASQADLFQQVREFIAALAAARPVLLLLDDLHWADPASLDLLRSLARSVADLPALLIATYRSDELTRRHPLYPLLPLLVREAGAVRLDLHRLEDDAVRALIAARYGLPDPETARLASAVQLRAEGNALFVGEVLRALEEGGALRREGAGWTLGALSAMAVPPLLAQVIERRLSRLGEDERWLLGVAAVIGHEVPLPIWAAVSEAEEDTLLDVAERGQEARLLVEETDRESVRFAHALIREAIYEGIPAIRRRRIHRRAAEALAATRHPDPDAVASHFQHAGDARAAPWLIAAGERAAEAYATLTAAARFEAALTLMEEDAMDAVTRTRLLLHLAAIYRYSTDARARVPRRSAGDDRGRSAHGRLRAAAQRPDPLV
jgi:predicted ATPase